MNKKIAIIGVVGIPAKYGGFETLTEYLTKDLSDDFDLTVYCSSKSYTERLDEYNGAKLVYLPLDANGMQSVFYDCLSIFKALRFADNLLILGVSGCIFLPIAKLFSDKKIIVNIDGLEWKREKWSKPAKIFLKLSEKLAVKYADEVIADNKVIQDYVQREYSKTSHLITYGADQANRLPLSPQLLDKYRFLHKNYAFTVCRIEPENNLHIILEAIVQQDAVQMVIVGNWQASQYGADLRKRYADFDHIYLLDPIYDQNCLNQIRSNCFIYMHGHSAGGTNPSLVEAMYLGLPVFAFDINYNRETTEHGALFFSDSMELLKLLHQTDEASLAAIGNGMSEIAKKRYRWQSVLECYAALFD